MFKVGNANMSAVLFFVFFLTYFHIKIFIRVKAKISYASWTQTIWQLNELDDFAINAIENLFLWKTEDPRGDKYQSNIYDGAFCENN